MSCADWRIRGRQKKPIIRCGQSPERKHFGHLALIPSTLSFSFIPSNLASGHIKKVSTGEGSFGVEAMSLRRSGLQKEVLSLYRRSVLSLFPELPAHLISHIKPQPPPTLCSNTM